MTGIWTPEADDFAETLRLFVTARASMQNDGLLYLGYEDYVLHHGLLFENGTPSKLREFESKTQHECFTNSLMAAVRFDDLIYVEGYASTSLFPVHHAWLVDQDGVVHDPTWDAIPGHDRSDAVYIGVPFDTTYVARLTTEKGTDTMFDPYGYGVPLSESPADGMIVDALGVPVPERLRGVDVEMSAKFEQATQ